MKRYNVRFFSIVIIIWALDVLTKFWAESALSGGNAVNLVGELLRFSLTYNRGGVFGIFQGYPLVFQGLTGLSITFLVLYYHFTHDGNNRFDLAISMILGGALGNFTDRFFREGVVDFIDMGVGAYRWPTWNVADAFILFGALTLLLAYFQMEKAMKEKEAASHTQPGE